MASILDRFKNLVTKNSQQTNVAFNKAIYNFFRRNPNYFRG